MDNKFQNNDSVKVERGEGDCGDVDDEDDDDDELMVVTVTVPGKRRALIYINGHGLLRDDDDQ